MLSAIRRASSRVRRCILTTRQLSLRDTYPFGMFAVPRDNLLRLHASSGTTGKPTVVSYTNGDLHLWSDLMARSLACAGVVPGDIVHNAYGYDLFTGGLGTHYGAERLGCTVAPVSGGGTERQVTLLADFGANVLCSTPSYALNIAEVAAGMGVDLRRAPPRLGAFGAEPWSDAIRRDLEEPLGIVAVDVYGLIKDSGARRSLRMPCRARRFARLGGSFSVRNHRSRNVSELPMGESGELVISTLTKEALPMIRYRTRDVTRLNSDPCMFGRTHVRIMRVTGRDDDKLIIRGMNNFPSQVEAVLVGFPGLAPHYQIVLTREGMLDVMTVEIETAPECEHGRRRTQWHG
jgi:phenylacetate-CoA ligase